MAWVRPIGAPTREHDPTSAYRDIEEEKVKKLYLLYASLKGMSVFFCSSVNFILSMSSLTVRPLQQGLQGVASYRLPDCNLISSSI